ncbi:PaaI family thioesterase [Pseudonocardia sp.]|uniref:PaaI family thioesterase n=1 Tax=Pseudonocardia sp. TaxID=60912 RepID=UPI002624BE1C|nr:PaaI family thioesterase [Pseudonocardia sp.]
MTDSDAVADRWRARFAAASAAARNGDVLPAHNPECLGCGPDNPHGFHLQVLGDGERVRAEHVFDRRHVGGPGVAHGGAVAAVLDDLCGFVPFALGHVAVTRHLGVDYRAPVVLGAPYALTAWLVRREGRKLFVRAEGHTAAGELAFSADGLFLEVDSGHFERATATR